MMWSGSKYYDELHHYDVIIFALVNGYGIMYTNNIDLNALKGASLPYTEPSVGKNCHQLKKGRAEFHLRWNRPP